MQILKMIPDMKEKFNTLVGFSDHTLGSLAPIVAVTLGAQIIEKHFILDKSIGGADADFSMDKNEFSKLILDIRNTEKLIGTIDYSMTIKKKKLDSFQEVFIYQKI